MLHYNNIYRDNIMSSTSSAEVINKASGDELFQKCMVEVADNQDKEAFSIIFKHFSPRLKSYTNPAKAKALSTTRLASAEIETNGNRTSELHSPRRSSAYLTGPGLASQNRPS